MAGTHNIYVEGVICVKFNELNRKSRNNAGNYVILLSASANLSSDLEVSLPSLRGVGG